LYNQLLSEPAVLHSQVLTRVQAPPPPGNNIYDTFPIGTWLGYNSIQLEDGSSQSRQILTEQLHKDLGADGRVMPHNGTCLFTTCNPTLYTETWTAVPCLFDITARVQNKYKCLGNRVIGYHSHIQHITVMYCWQLISPLYLLEDEVDFGLVSRGILRPTKSYLEADPSS